MKSRLVTLVLVFSLVLMPAVAMAGWAGSQTITVEWHDEPLTIYTTVQDYSIVDAWHITLVVDRHPILGTDMDLSSTVYLDFRALLYATVGVRKGIYSSTTPIIPYASVTIRF